MASGDLGPEAQSMKKSIYFLVALAAAPAYAAESAPESRFHLFTTRCEAESDDGPEATPQSPPLAVDDPGTPGCNHWEINIVVDGDVTRSERSLELPLLDVNYGIGDNIQLKYEVPYVSSRPTDADGVSAIGQSKAGVKYKFFENEGSKLELAVYPQMSFVGSSSDAVSKGLETSGTVTTLPLLMSMKLGETSLGEVDLTANAGYNLSGKVGVANYLSASAGVGTALSRRVALMAGISTEQAVSAVEDEKRKQVTRADLGVIAGLSRTFLLLGSIGHSIQASDDLSHAYGLVGVRLNFNPRESL